MNEVLRQLANDAEPQPVPEVDTENLSLEQLRELDAQQPQAEQEEQPRDDQGRFAKAEAPAEEEVVEEAVVEPPKPAPVKKEEVIVRRVVDLGDGFGKQVFYGKGVNKEEALEDVADLLTTAQLNATRKIRELNKKIQTKAPEKRLTADEEFILAQELNAKPGETTKKLYKEYRAEEERVKQENSLVEQGFVTSHPDYVVCAANATEIYKWAESHQSAANSYAELLELAYQDLSASGLLQLKTEEAPSVQESPEPVEQRIASKAEVGPPQPRTPVRKASGLSTRGRAPVPVKTEPSEQELYEMPLEKLLELGRTRR